jgi:hypothetical protein
VHGPAEAIGEQHEADPPLDDVPAVGSGAVDGREAQNQPSGGSGDQMDLSESLSSLSETPGGEHQVSPLPEGKDRELVGKQSLDAGAKTAEGEQSTASDLSSRKRKAPSSDGSASEEPQLCPPSKRHKGDTTAAVDGDLPSPEHRVDGDLNFPPPKMVESSASQTQHRD